jgi:hypothetical protein
MFDDKKEQLEFTVRTRGKDSAEYLVKFTHRVCPSGMHDYSFRGISGGIFIDMLLQYHFEMPCMIDVITVNGNYHSVHLDKYSDIHQFFRGWMFAMDDIRFVDESPVPHAWLQKMVGGDLSAIHEIEIKDFEETCREPVPADVKERITTTRFKVPLEPGDQIWSFSNGHAAFASLAGRAGYALVRKGEIIDAFVTRLS